MNMDQAAIRIMLNATLSQKAKQAALTKLARTLKDRLNNRIECPDCGDMGPHHDNGAETLCCQACGMHFDLNPV